MLGFLDFLGTLGGNILSLPGILGLAAGMATRNWLIAAALGACIGILETLLFNGFRLPEIEIFDLLIAVAVGIAAACLGCAIRHKGATV